MSDVIREATILIRYKTEKGNLSSPDVAQISKAHEEVAKSVEHVARAHSEAARAAKEFAAVPQDWGQLFKSQAEAKNFAYQQYGARGAQYLKDDPEHIASLKRIADLNGEAGDKAEQFGRRSEQSFIAAGRGALQFARGLAMLSAGGGEDTKVILENLIKIEAASQLTMGIANLAKFSSGLGVLSVAALAGTGAWMLYAQQVDKAKKELEGLAEAQRKESQAETKAQQERESIRNKGQAAQTDATFSTPEKRAAQLREQDDIRRRRAEAEQQFAANESARTTATQRAERARSEAKTLPGGLIEGLLMGWSSASQIGEAAARKEQLEKLAKKQEGSATEFAGREQANINQRLQDAEREKSIIEQQRTDQIQQVRKQEQERLDNLRRSDEMMSPMEKGQRTMEKFQFDQDKAEFTRQLTSLGSLVPFGGAAATRDFTFQGSREQPIRAQAQQSIDRINEGATKSLQSTEAMLTNLQTLLTNINEEIAKQKAAHPN